MAQLELARHHQVASSPATVLDDISLAAEAGEIVVVFGPSGTGKTVLLRLIAGVEEPTPARSRSTART